MAAHRCAGLDLRSRDRHLRRSPPKAEWPARRLSSRPQPAPSSAGRLSTTARTAEGRCPSGSGRDAFSSSALRGRPARSERPTWRAAFASVEGPEGGRVSSSIAVDEGHRLQGLEHEVVIRQLTARPATGIRRRAENQTFRRRWIRQCARSLIIRVQRHAHRTPIDRDFSKNQVPGTSLDHSADDVSNGSAAVPTAARDSRQGRLALLRPLATPALLLG